MSAERKSAERTTPTCSEEQPAFLACRKNYGWRPADLRIAGSQAANLRTGGRPVPGRGRARSAPFSVASIRV